MSYVSNKDRDHSQAILSINTIEVKSGIYEKELAYNEF